MMKSHNEDINSMSMKFNITDEQLRIKFTFNDDAICQVHTPLH